MTITGHWRSVLQPDKLVTVIKHEDGKVHYISGGVEHTRREQSFLTMYRRA